MPEQTTVPDLLLELSETPANGDLLHIVDVSDTTDNADGTSKKITRQNLVGGLATQASVTSAQAEIDEVETDFAVEHNANGTHKSETVTTLKASSAEVSTGTNDAKIVTPDALAGSNYGKKSVSLPLNGTAALTTGDGKFYVRIPSELNGWNLVAVAASRVSGTGVPLFQVHNVTQAADMLSTRISIDSGETDSSTAAAPAVIDTANDDVATADRIRIDVDDAGTDTLWAEVQLTFQLP